MYILVIHIANVAVSTGGSDMWCTGTVCKVCN